MFLQASDAPPFYKNGYVIACERTRQGVVIDPGDEVDALLDLVRGNRLDIRFILLTHAHVDHVSGAARARSALGAPIFVHSADLSLYEAVPRQAAFFGLDVEAPPAPDRFYDPAEAITFGDYMVRVLPTPGHSPGGVCLLVGPQGQPGTHLFSGDTLFAGSIGRTDLPRGDYGALIQSIREVLLGLPDEVEVYPGHGPKTTIGRERTTNPFLIDERR